MPYPACLISQRKWSTESNNERFIFPLTIDVVTINILIPHYQKIFDSIWPGVKEKASFDNFTFYFYSGKIIPSRLIPSFEALTL
jgi:hypothetical protein